MLSRVERLNDDINTLFANEREELWQMQGVVPNTVDLIARAIEEYEYRKLAKRMLSVPEAADYLGVSDYIIRTWITDGTLRNENLSGGRTLISMQQLEDLPNNDIINVLLKLKANKKSGTIPAPPFEY